MEISEEDRELMQLQWQLKLLQDKEEILFNKLQQVKTDIKSKFSEIHLKKLLLKTR